MKANFAKSRLAAGVAFCLCCPAFVFAGQPSDMPAAKSCSGIANDISPLEKTVSLKEFWGTRRFTVANDCKVTADDNPNASLASIHPGQKLEIWYDNDRGVRVAHQISQQDMVFTGDVQSIDPLKHTMTVRDGAHDKNFQLADDCKVVLRDHKSGALTDARVGERVSVVYETPSQAVLAMQITQTSREYSGTLTAIDQGNRTLKAKSFMGSRTFNLADDCKIVINGRTDGNLADLRIGDPVVFNYDNNSGVLVASRVGRETADGKESPPVAGNQDANPGLSQP